MSCISCGAPIGGGSLICEFCGTAQQAITDPVEEVKAVQQLSIAWSKMGQQTAREGRSLLSQMYGQGHPIAVTNRAKNFWSSAYMPSTSEGLFAAAEQAAMMVADIKFGDTMAPTLNPIMLSRMDNCLEMLEIKAPGDPRLAGLTRLYHKKKAENAGIAKKLGFCFPATTRFLTPSGYRPLGDLDRGDSVISVDQSGRLVTQRIARKVHYGPSEILCITAGEHTLRTTAHHSLMTNSGWALAGDVAVGDTIQHITSCGVIADVCVSNVRHEPPETVFNLHTTGPHTAVVEGMVTHNFNKLRWLRVRWHQWFVDPWVGPTQARAALLTAR